MIVARSPLRITLGGVGTDIPAYYRDHGGYLVGAAIDKHVYVAVSRPLAEGISIRGQETQHAASVDEVTHPIIRQALRTFGDDRPQIEIVTFSDVPPGTGLGSSGSFTTALLLALHAHHGSKVSMRDLAEQACDIEIGHLGQPIGKQDQYMAACGGLTCLTFARNGTVTVEPLRVDDDTRRAMEDMIVLFFTGRTRSASDILRGQVERLERREPAMVDSLHFEMDNANRSREALEAGDLPLYGRLLSAHWDRKRQRSVPVSTPAIDRLYEIGLRSGAFGGKLVGAGGAGFLMFCASNKARLREAMHTEGLAELPFRFVDDGTQTVSQ